MQADDLSRYIMQKMIPISIETQTLIRKLHPTLLTEMSDVNSELELNKVILMLNHLSSEDSSEPILVESLRALLLCDLSRTLSVKQNVETVNKFSLVKFWILVISGTVLASYEGFDAVSSLLPWLSFPAWISPVIVVFFVLSSIATFYAFDLGQISENLGVSLPESPKLLDKLVEQAKEIRHIRKSVQHKIKSQSFSEDDLNTLIQIVEMLQSRQTHLTMMQETYQKKAAESYLGIVKKVTGFATGLLFFSSGFFVSQVPLTALFTLFNLSATAMVFPVMLLSVIGGVAAFASYWYMQRPGFDQFISRMFGFDEEKIASLDACKINEVTRHQVTGTEKLEDLRGILALRKRKLLSNLLDEPTGYAFFMRKTCEVAVQTEPEHHALINSMSV